MLVCPSTIIGQSPTQDVRVVKQISTGKLVYRESPDFEDGYGIINAHLMFGYEIDDLQEITVTVSQWEDAINTFDVDELPHSQHIAQLTGVDVTKVKPLEVTRRYRGKDYTENCFVSQTIIGLYQAGRIAIGDYVIVSYIAEMPGQEELILPIVVDKVFVSWE